MLYPTELRSEVQALLDSPQLFPQEKNRVLVAVHIHTYVPAILASIGALLAVQLAHQLRVDTQPRERLRKVTQRSPPAEQTSPDAGC